jgi:hypothetical protein
LILNLYDAYSGAAADVTTLVPANTGPATATDLRSNYDYMRDAVQDIRAVFFQHNAAGKCPLCATNQATTIDHYLPRTLYPEFAILPLNLVPCCAYCNHAKGSTYASDGAALFLHVYFDEIPRDERFLFAEASVEHRTVVVSFRVEPPASIAAPLNARITTHFERLDLATYYINDGVREISERQSRLKAMLADGLGPADIREYLTQEAGSVARATGVNYWKYAVLIALADNPEVCAGEFDASFKHVATEVCASATPCGGRAGVFRLPRRAVASTSMAGRPSACRDA